MKNQIPKLWMVILGWVSLLVSPQKGPSGRKEKSMTLWAIMWACAALPFVEGVLVSAKLQGAMGQTNPGVHSIPLRISHDHSPGLTCKEVKIMSFLINSIFKTMIHNI